MISHPASTHDLRAVDDDDPNTAYDAVFAMVYFSPVGATLTHGGEPNPCN